MNDDLLYCDESNRKNALFGVKTDFFSRSTVYFICTYAPIYVLEICGGKSIYRSRPCKLFRRYNKLAHIDSITLNIVTVIKPVI